MLSFYILIFFCSIQDQRKAISVSTMCNCTFNAWNFRHMSDWNVNLYIWPSSLRDGNYYFTNVYIYAWYVANKQDKICIESLYYKFNCNWIVFTLQWVPLMCFGDTVSQKERVSSIPACLFSMCLSHHCFLPVLY